MILTQTPCLQENGQKPNWAPWTSSSSRLWALQLQANNTFDPPVELTEADALGNYLQRSLYSEREPPRRSVLILEGLPTSLVDVLQTYLQPHPAVFTDHERLAPHGDRKTGEAGGIPFLPSAVHGREYVTMKYHEPVVLSCRPNGFRNRCSISGRHIATTRLMGKFSSVAVLRRKCTFWSRSTESGGWICLIICDPPVRMILTDHSGQNGFHVQTSPYQNGYVDFADQKSQLKCGEHPSHASFLEDMAFYLLHHSRTLDLETSPKPLRVFMEKMVASHYLKLASFMQANMELLQWNLSRHQNLTGFAVATAEEQWSDVQSWHRRIAEYQDDLLGIMAQLQVPRKSSLLPPAALVSTVDDYQFLHHRFADISARLRDLGSAIAALASLAGNRAAYRTAERAGHEAKSVRALTMLGFVFVPLTYAASVFSMSAPYGPGGRLFWLYFVVASICLVAVVLGYWALQRGYWSAVSSYWSFGALLRRGQPGELRGALGAEPGGLMV